MQGAGGVGGLLMTETTTDGGTTWTPAYHLYDGNGNVSTVVDGSGAVQASYTYDPYGRVVASSGGHATTNVWRFSTKPVDAETGWSYYGYRYYSADLGRWTARDLIQEKGGINLYAMLWNNALSRIDMLGLDGYAIPAQVCDKDDSMCQDQSGASCDCDEMTYVVVFDIKPFTADHFVGHSFIELPGGHSYGQYPAEGGVGKVHGPGEIKEDDKNAQFCRDRPERCDWRMISMCPSSAAKLRDSILDDKANPPDYGLGPGGCPNCKEWTNSQLSEAGFSTAGGWTPGN